MENNSLEVVKDGRSNALSEIMEFKNCDNEIAKNIGTISCGFVEMGKNLKVISDKKLYTLDNYDSIYDYAEKRFNIKSTTVKNLINIAEKFLDDHGKIVPEFKDYTYSQLIEIDKISDTSYEKLNPNMSVRDIKNLQIVEKLDSVMINCLKTAFNKVVSGLKNFFTKNKILNEQFEIDSFNLNENFEKVKIIHDSTYPYAYVGLKVKFSKCGEKKKTIQEIYPFIYFEVAKNGEILTKKSRLVTTKHYYSYPDSELWFYLENRPVENLDNLEKSIVSFLVEMMSDKDSARMDKIKEESRKKKIESLEGKKIKLTLKEVSRNSREDILVKFGLDIEKTLNQVEFFYGLSGKLFLILNEKLCLACEHFYDLDVFSYKIENNQYVLVKKLKNLDYVRFFDLFQDTDLLKELIKIDNLFDRFVKFVEYMYENQWHAWDEVVKLGG